MTPRRKRYAIISSLTAAAVIATAVALPRINRYRTITVRGAVVRDSADLNKRIPIAGVKIAALSGDSTLATATSDNNGGFSVTIHRVLLNRHGVTLKFSHRDYKPYKIDDPSGSELYIAALAPLRDNEPAPSSDKPKMPVTHVSIRYTLKTSTLIEVGSATKTFRIDSNGNTPCNGRPPCSPDGKWKAWVGGASLDAGPGNYFRNGRVSCIAGPCPFTRISRDDFSQKSRHIDVTVLGWSDATTFLLQAEAVRESQVDNTNRAWPIIFDHTMSFSLPSAAEGICIEADLNGIPIIFPINPNFSLSWANCEIQSQPENNQLYRCDLKPDYVFAAE